MFEDGDRDILWIPVNQQRTGTTLEIGTTVDSMPIISVLVGSPSAPIGPPCQCILPHRIKAVTRAGAGSPFGADSQGMSLEHPKRKRVHAVDVRSPIHMSGERAQKIWGCDGEVISIHFMQLIEK